MWCRFGDNCLVQEMQSSAPELILRTQKTRGEEPKILKNLKKAVKDKEEADYSLPSRIMDIAFFGHSFAQMPHPLQKMRSISNLLSMTPSGQYIAHIPQELHFSRSTTGRNTRQVPVFPQAPSTGLEIASRSLIPPTPHMPSWQHSDFAHLQTSRQLQPWQNPVKRDPSLPVHR